MKRSFGLNCSRNEIQIESFSFQRLMKSVFEVLQGSRLFFAMITYNISDLLRENTNCCKNGEEAHNETIRAYGAMGFRKLD